MKIGRGVSELLGVENRPLPLTWPMANTTACTTVQAVITHATPSAATPTSYLPDEIHQSSDVGARPTLRSASSSSLVVRRTRLSTIGDQDFPAAT